MPCCLPPGYPMWTEALPLEATPLHIACAAAIRMQQVTGHEAWGTHFMLWQPAMPVIDLHCVVTPRRCAGAHKVAFLADFRRVCGPGPLSFRVPFYEGHAHTDDAALVCEAAEASLIQDGLRDAPGDFCISTPGRGGLLVPVSGKASSPSVFQLLPAATSCYQWVNLYHNAPAPSPAACFSLSEGPDVLARLGVPTVGVVTLEFPYGTDLSTMICRLRAATLSHTNLQGRISSRPFVPGFWLLCVVALAHAPHAKQPLDKRVLWWR